MSSQARVTTRERGPWSEDNILSQYLEEISAVPLLSLEEEQRLCREAARGDRAARERLVQANLRFVVSVARRYRNRGLPQEDLISEGNVGLLHAIERYDVSKGYRFISYAVWWIRRSILNAINAHGRTIRLPRTRIVELARWKDAGEKVTTRHEAMLAGLVREPISLDAPAGSGDNAVPMRELIEDTTLTGQDEQVIQRSLKEDIDAALATLDRKEAQIIRDRFGLDGRTSQSFGELGEQLSLTRERVRQIEKKALGRLRSPARAHLLQDYRPGA